MAKIKFKIDEKSYFFGIQNDMLKGHTATVATILKQGSSIKSQYFEFLKLKNYIELSNREDLIDLCLMRSKSTCKILRVFSFHNIYVNNIKIQNNFDFAIYIKEEIDPSAYQYGRVKLHYPKSLKYFDGTYDINNEENIKLIQQCIGDFAFLINYFEINDEESSINFDVTIIGEKDIAYSKVFRNSKGGINNFSKIFTEEADAYDYEIIATKKALKYDISPEEYNLKLSSTKMDLNGKLTEILKAAGAENINPVYEKYGYSPVDIEFYYHGNKIFVITKFTSTNVDTFFMSKHELMLINKYKENSFVCLFKNIFSKELDYYWIASNEINDFSKEIVSLRYHK